MIKRKIVSTILTEVRANASFSTRKPSTVTMEINRRLSSDAYNLYLDQLENIDPETGLVGFELVALYEDGEPEPVPEFLKDMTFDVDPADEDNSNDAPSEDNAELPFEDENDDIIEEEE